MARTIWGAHKRYMDTYLNVYKGYYVGQLLVVDEWIVTDNNSLLAMGLDVTTKVTTGSEDVLMMLLMLADIVSLPLKSKQPSLSTMPLQKLPSLGSVMSLRARQSLLLLLSRTAMSPLRSLEKHSSRKFERALGRSPRRNRSLLSLIYRRHGVVRLCGGF
jgi:hypothetical protein